MKTKLLLLGSLFFILNTVQAYAGGPKWTAIGTTKTEADYYFNCKQTDLGFFSLSFMGQSLAADVDIVMALFLLAPEPTFLTKVVGAAGVLDLGGRFITGPSDCTGLFGIDDSLVLAYAKIFDGSRGHMDPDWQYSIQRYNSVVSE